MSRTLTAATIAEAASEATRPLYFFEIDLGSAQYLRLSSRGEISWNDLVFVAGAFVAQGLDGGGNGQVAIADPDGAFAVLGWSTDLSDRPIRIWKAYVGALAAADPVECFAGVVDGFESDESRGIVTLALSRARSNRRLLPGIVVAPEYGFPPPLPAGTKLSIGGQTLLVED